MPQPPDNDNPDLMTTSRKPKGMIKLNTGLNVGGPANVQHVGGHGGIHLKSAKAAGAPLPQRRGSFRC